MSSKVLLSIYIVIAAIIMAVVSSIVEEWVDKTIVKEDVLLRAVLTIFISSVICTGILLLILKYFGVW